MTRGIFAYQQRRLSANVKLNHNVHNIQLNSMYWRDNRLMFEVDTRPRYHFYQLSNAVIAAEKSTTNWFPLRV